MKFIYLIISLIAILSSCAEEEIESNEECTDLITEQQWQLAINCFEEGEFEAAPSELAEPDDYNYLFYWAGAYGGKYGLVGSDIVSGFADSSEGSGLPIDINGIVAILASAGGLAEAIADMKRALDLLTAFPQKYRSNGSEAVYFSNDLSLVSVIFASFLIELQKTDFLQSLEDGSVDPSQLAEKADEFLDYLEKSTSVIGDDELSSAISEQIDSLNDQPGETTAEKLENFLD